MKSKYDNSKASAVFDAMLLLVMGVIFVMCFFFLILPQLENGVQCGDTVRNTPMLSIKDRFNTEGSFVLGSGYIRQEPQYTFYIHDDTYGGLKLQYVDAADTRIFEDATPETGARWIVKRNCNIDTTSMYMNELHVPPGTIKPDFDLDGI